MKRRVMIGKALSHEPKILFLDEPTAGVDVSLEKTLWSFLNKLKSNGITIFLYQCITLRKQKTLLIGLVLLTMGKY